MGVAGTARQAAQTPRSARRTTGAAVRRVVSRADSSVVVACSAAATRVCCSISWILVIPVAGAADGPRPAYTPVGVHHQFLQTMTDLVPAP